MYGGAESEYDWKNCPGGAEISLHTVNGKGMIYGGYIRMLGILAAFVDRPIILIDDKVVSDLKYSELYEYGILDVSVGPLFLTAYDRITGIYNVGISGGITFENTVELRYDSNTGVAKPVRYGIIYALV